MIGVTGLLILDTLSRMRSNPIPICSSGKSRRSALNGSPVLLTIASFLR
jgi:hypothetical protein